MAEEGGATAKTTTSSTSPYGGGGGRAGGKFRKKPIRKPATPYDRPPVVLRRNDSSDSWLTKLVLDPASKLISYGAHRLFASVFCKRLPPPPPPPLPKMSELTHVPRDGFPDAIPDNQNDAQEPVGGEFNQPIRRSSGRNGIFELEQLLKQKTFTRSEIDHLRELLHSRSGEVSLGDDEQRNEETAFDFKRPQQFYSSPLEANRNEGGRSHRLVSTPISNSKVLGDGTASPAELAKLYMGSRPSKVSLPMQGKLSQVAGEDTRLLGNMSISSKPPNMSLKIKTSVGPGSPGNGSIITPRSRSRSAIYNMSRSLYSKGSGTNHYGYAGQTVPSTSLSLVENGERSIHKTMTLKRRSYVLDDEVGSDGPIRRIRQKFNLISPEIPLPDGVGFASDSVVVSSKQKLPLIGDPTHIPKEENTDNNHPSTSYTQVPPKSSEVAAKTLEHEEHLTSKEKSSLSRLITLRGKSPFKLTPSMLRGQALRSMEDVTSSELLLNVQDADKFEDASNATLLGGHDHTFPEQGKVEENCPVESYVPSDTCYPILYNDSAVSLKASCVRNITSDYIAENGVSQFQNKKAFRMTAPEDYVELDDDLPFSEERGQLKTLNDGKFSPAGEPRLVKTSFGPELKSPSGLMSSKTSELSGVAGAALLEGRSNGFTTPALEDVNMVPQSAVLPPSVTVFDKHLETNNPAPFLNFISKAADKFPSLMSESSSRTPETEPESSSSLFNISTELAPTGSLVKILDLEKGGHLEPPVPENRNGISDTSHSAATNWLLVSSTSSGSFTAASFDSTNQISIGVPAIFTPSTSVSDVPSGTGDITSATTGGCIFGAASTPAVSDGPVSTSGASLGLSTKVSAASTMILPATGDMKTKAVTDPSSSSSSGPFTNVIAKTSSSGNITSEFSSSAGSSTSNSLEASLSNNPSNSIVSAVRTVSQGTSVQSLVFASPPSSNMNSCTSVSSLLSSQVFNPITSFVSYSSASSLGTGANVASTGSTSSIFGVNPTGVSDGVPGSSGSVSAPSIFSFGFSSSSFTNAVGSTGVATSPVFSFGVGSSISASMTNTTSSFSIFPSINAVGSTGGTTPAFGLGASSPVSASVTNTNCSFSSGTTGVFHFGGSSSASSSASNSINCNSGPNAKGSSWQTPNSSIFGSTLASATPAYGFAFGASSTSSTPTNAAPVVFNSSTAPSSSALFQFTTASAPVISSPSPCLTKPVFGNPASGFSTSPGNDQMNAEDSMAEDPVQSAAPPAPVFGQTFIPPPSGFMFGSTVPAQANPFQFGGQQNQVAPQNPPMFQATSSLEFNAGGTFSLGSAGGDKSGRKFVKINRNKNRKK